MAHRIRYAWSANGSDNTGVSFVCGHCGTLTSAFLTWIATTHQFHHGVLAGDLAPSFVHVCSACTKPSSFDAVGGAVTPGQRVGSELKRLPPPVSALWNEARDSMGVRAYTAAAMLARKPLMNLAVHEGASGGLKFIEYVDYLVSNNYVPPKGKQWVNRIRDKGNEANHEIRQVPEAEAIEVIELTELLLRFNYELSDPAASP